MAEKQGIPQDAPPPYSTDVTGLQNPSYDINQGNPPQGQPGYPPQGQPGYPPQGQPGYPPQEQPKYPPQPQQGYPPQPQMGYPPQPQPGFHQGYPPTTGQPGYGYSQQPMPSGTIQNNVTVVQTGGPMVVGAVFPPDYCGLAWFACLCCCWPIGICAILNSNHARDAINRGDLAMANTHSQLARKYAYSAIGFGLVLMIIGVVLRLVVFTTMTTTYNYND